MSTNNSDEWVKAGTPREDWDSDTDYGVEVDPSEWNDYSDEQAVHVPTPQAARDYQPADQPVAAGIPAAEAPVRAETPMRAEAEPQNKSFFEPDEVSATPMRQATPGSEPTQTAPRDGRDLPPSLPVSDALVTTEAPQSYQEQQPELQSVPDQEQTVFRKTDSPVQQVSVPPRPSAPSDETRLSVDPIPPQRRAADTEAAAAGEESEPTTQHAAFAKPVSESSMGGAAAVGAAAVTGGEQLASLYRDGDSTMAIEHDDEGATQVLDPETARKERLRTEEAEEEARQARLQEQRDARDVRLGVVAGSEAGGVRIIAKPVKRQADRFFGAFSLFALRCIIAFIIGVLGYQVLQNVDAAANFLSGTVLPYPRIVAWSLGFGFAAIAVLLVLGFGARIWGFVLTAVAITSLATVRWGQFSIFQPGVDGFLGDRTLLTVGASLVILAFGAGAFSIDGAIYASRQKRKAANAE